MDETCAVVYPIPQLHVIRLGLQQLSESNKKQRFGEQFPNVTCAR